MPPRFCWCSLKRVAPGGQILPTTSGGTLNLIKLQKILDQATIKVRVSSSSCEDMEHSRFHYLKGMWVNVCNVTCFPSTHLPTLLVGITIGGMANLSSEYPSPTSSLSPLELVLINDYLRILLCWVVR